MQARVHDPLPKRPGRRGKPQQSATLRQIALKKPRHLPLKVTPRRVRPENGQPVAKRGVLPGDAGMVDQAEGRALKDGEEGIEPRGEGPEFGEQRVERRRAQDGHAGIVAARAPVCTVTQERLTLQ